MRTCLMALIVLCLASSTGLGAARPAGDPVDQVKVATSRIATIAKAATDQGAMVGQIEGVMAEIVDFEGFSARTLGDQWSGLKAAQRTRFTTAFRGLVIGTYAKRFKVGATFRVTYRGETRYTERPTATVRTTIHGAKVSADVDYLFAPSGASGWRAVDIVVDEVSMARNWRGQFKRILARDGFDVLIARIEKKAGRR